MNVAIQHAETGVNWSTLDRLDADRMVVAFDTDHPKRFSADASADAVLLKSVF